MTYINILLDKAKEISSSPTDMALAKELGVTRSAIANYRHGVSVPKDIVCAKLALLTGESYTKIAASMGEEKAVSKADKLTWRKLSQVAVLIICTLPIASIYAAELGVTSGNLAGLYIMSTGVLTLFSYWYRFSRHDQFLHA